MNQYHIYEAIGHGKCSVSYILLYPFPRIFVSIAFCSNPFVYISLQTVYKGRKKKTIEYFACKSVDKSRKSKVLQEVITRSVSSLPNE